jgi:hypothetical protein
MRHCIKKQVLLLQIASGLDAFSVQQAVSSCYWEEILPALEKVFDELSSEGECIRLDRLEIDLGKIAAGDLRSVGTRDMLYTLVRRQLQEALDQEDRDKRGVYFRASAPERALWEWWHYMEHGRLHWGQVSPTEEWYCAVLERLSVDYAAAGRLRGSIKKEGRLLQRIAAQHGDGFLETLVGILVAEKQRGLEALVADVVRVTELLEMLWREVRDVGDGRRKGWIGAILAKQLRSWQAGRRDFLSLAGYRRKEAVWRLVLRWAAEGGLSPGSGAGKRLVDWLLGGDGVLIGRLKKEGAALGPEMLLLLDEAGKKDRRPKTEGKDPEAREVTAPDGPAIEPLPVEAFTREDVDTEGMYLSHAGVILLHPFLATCFSRLHWWEDGQFADVAVREKAVFLVHYLATGRAEAPEYELVLPKVLCGYSPEAALPERVELTPAEYGEAEELLEMVLVRWEKLQGSSVTGLRESFLQRGGKLFRRNERLILQVEQHAIDVLLDYMPWNLGLVKLPWLRETIYVEWR